MEITITHGTVDLIAVNGSIDALTSPEVIATIQTHIQAGHPNVALDFSKVEFMSSAGLRAILVCVKGARAAGGDLRLGGPQPAVDRVMKMAGFHNIVKMFASAQDAINSFGS